METATVNGVELEYEVVGSGEPACCEQPCACGASCRSCPNRRWPTATS